MAVTSAAASRKATGCGAIVPGMTAAPACMRPPTARKKPRNSSIVTTPVRAQFVKEIAFLVFAAHSAAGKAFPLQFGPAYGFKHGCEMRELLE